MELIAAIAGGLLGYLLSENVIAESWWYKCIFRRYPFTNSGDIRSLG